MPANLPPQYYQAEKGYRAARTPQEKIEALELMLAIMPKHKGTDKLRADLRRRIARTTDELEKTAARKGYSYRIRREGAGQVILVGLPNVGKSRLLGALTEASPEVGDYPFTTRTATPGMMRFENIQIQLVDTTPVNDHNARAWLPALLRACDAILIVVDLGQDPLEQLDVTIKELRGFKIALGDGEQGEGIVGKAALVVGNKSDRQNAVANYARLSLRCGDKLPTIAVSAERDSTLEELRKRVFDILNIVRVYTKARSGKPDFDDPVILRVGETVEDFARVVHKDFHHRLKYANIWGSGKYDGQRVSRDYVLHDGDVIELHI